MKYQELPIFILSASRWDQDLSSAALSMAREISKETKVFLVEHPFSIKDILRRPFSGPIRTRLPAMLFGRKRYRHPNPLNGNLTVITPPITFSINWLPPGGIYNFFCEVNNWIFFRMLRRALKDFRIGKFVYLNSYNPFFSYRLPGDVKPELFIYQSRDNIAESDYVSKHGPALERQAALNADFRLATSLNLVELLSTPDKPFYYFPNAADSAMFSKSREKSNFMIPPELEERPGRVIGYIGNIDMRQDYVLLNRIATTFEDCTLLMVGPMDTERIRASGLDKHKNVIFSGRKKLEELPRYLAFMDVAIIPFVINKLTRSIYPLKLNEYLASGKPVVATDFSPDLGFFRQVAYISIDKDQFISNVERALQESDPELAEARIRIAHENSWQNRVVGFWSLIGSKASRSISGVA